ncbi:hypothetical protein COX24_04165 [bacterium (Candidatus Gribaldobacteria) CG23_combo_of_CG06-09_8_20_14_all_37_87_8]|uniref:Uncharacterized protein n=1 Tax=bacterium (Candidatus Gribaldobacteria) CG23_combo_of_CG06-09_8_20_14_all_37_87_8 TaxID=2014278 RepID=A0A2G9ZDR9_9BACT|nr:MAG: hypothetical protein AUJ25_00645 [Parcubacteria group bacterium CG1_02_37_13]PIP31329.1 MAG: hypothetical protein COX24_04165 [bacterium (Candidatus Gribaldobacteria) CG23_combo_of_CG06-09_8_20_14_all_37_87_8]
MEKIVINDPEGTPTKHLTVPSGEIWFFKNLCILSIGPSGCKPGSSFFCPHRAIIVKMSFVEVMESLLQDTTLKVTTDLILDRMAKNLTQE